MDADTTGRWLSTALGAVAIGLSLLVVGIYGWGRSFEESEQVTAQAHFNVPPAEVWGVLGDPKRRPEWRPRVDRIARIDDDAAGRPVWRELDFDEDRFDFAIVSQIPERRLTIAIASPDQIGIEGGWDFQIEPANGGSQIRVTESRSIANPFWRGLYHLTRGSHATVDQELDMLATFLHTEIRVEHP